METLKAGWWRIAAGLIAVGLAFVGIGNLLEDDGGPLYGRIIAASVAVVAAALTLIGLVVRRHHRVRGSTMTAIGTLPATLLIVFFWFPPVALAGVLAIVVVVFALRDAIEGRGTADPAEVGS